MGDGGVIKNRLRLLQGNLGSGGMRSGRLSMSAALMVTVAWRQLRKIGVNDSMHCGAAM